MIAEDRVAPKDDLLAVALARWQHAAGDYWPYVCAAPFLGELTAPPQRPRRTALSRWLAATVAALPGEAPLAVFVDLPPAQTLPATADLNRAGFVVVPIIQRWTAQPARLAGQPLLDRLVGCGALARRPEGARGVVFLLDGDRAGRPGPASPRSTRFDNRYDYSLDRFPPPDFLRDRGVTAVCWIRGGDIAPDLRPYLEQLCGAVPDGPHPGPLSNAVGEGDAESRRLPLRQRWTGDRGEATSYRRFVLRAQLRGMMADHLVRGEPYLAPDALVLSAEDVAELRRLTDLFSGAIDRAGRCLASDVPGLVDLGFPWAAAELLAAEPRRVPILGRFDFVRDVQGRWQLLELNADTPSGVREAIAVEAIRHELLPSPRPERPSAGLGPALVEAFLRATADLPPGRALGLVTDAGELEDLAQMAFTQRLLEGELAARGVPIVLGDVDDLRAGSDGPRLRGRRLSALYRYVPFELSFGSPAFAAIYDGVASGRLRLLNGLYGLLLQNKALLAWLWAHREDRRFSEAEREAIRHHLPPTYRIAEVAPRAGDPNAVVKQVFGREGEEVRFGDDLDLAAWRQLRAERTHVVQERVPIDPVEAIIATSAGPRRQTGFATVGSYAVDGRWAGFYTRFGGKIITSRAKWLATFMGKCPS